MTDEIEVGDTVEAIGAQNVPSIKYRPIKVGEVLTVREVLSFRPPYRYLRFKEIVNPPFEYSIGAMEYIYGASVFKLVRKAPPVSAYAVFDFPDIARRTNLRW